MRTTPGVANIEDVVVPAIPLKVVVAQPTDVIAEVTTKTEASL